MRTNGGKSDFWADEAARARWGWQTDGGVSPRTFGLCGRFADYLNEPLLSGNGANPTSLPPHPGWLSAAPFWPPTVHRAFLRSRSLDASGPYRISNCAKVIGVPWLHRAQWTRVQCTDLRSSANVHGRDGCSDRCRWRAR